MLSLLVAGSFALTVLARWMGHTISFAVGALLAVAFLEVLPTALERSSHDEALLAVLLGGLLLFFILQKAALWRHSHAGSPEEHEHAGHAHAPGTPLTILIGDGFHNFVDGVLIAGAFATDAQLGLVTTAAVIAHEIPQEIGDFMILLHSGFSRRRALVWNLLTSLTSVAGGVLGYLLLDKVQQAIPYVLSLAAASFIYVALSDLIPGMQRRWDAKAATYQVSLICAGIAVIATMHFFH